MHPFQNVLCATDLSESADEALRQAASIASRNGARLVVMYVVPFPMPMGEGPVELVDRQAMIAAAREKLEGQLVVASQAVSVATEVTLERRGTASDILEKADSMRADLVVVGSHRHSALKRVLLGSTADKLVRHTRRPVLVARPTADAGTVIVATDLTDVSQQLVQLAAEEAQRRRASLIAVHCLDLPSEVVGLGSAPMVPAPPDFPNSRAALRHTAEDRVIGYLTRAKVDASVVIEDGPPGRDIVALAEQLSAELVVVGTSGRTGLKRLVLGSVAEAIVHKAPASVLVVPIL